MKTIKSKSPVRESLSEVNSQYWEKPGRAISRIGEVLREHGVEFADIISFNDSLEDYRTTYRLQNVEGGHPGLEVEPQDLGNVLVFAWHRMPSGRFEINSYIS